jgi:uncharacterized BrkB/YihY/UPF0761 family membrane protein
MSLGSQHARWWVVVVGGWLVLWTGYSGAKAMILVHAAVWEVRPNPIRNPLLASLGFTGSVLAFAASMALVQWVRSESQTFALVATLASAIVPLWFWLVVSAQLPHRGSGWRDLLPGALVVAVGVHGMYLFTTWFLGPKLASATATYGLLGVVATVLFWLYIFGRLVIGGATLNASVHDRRHPDDGPGSRVSPDDLVSAARNGDLTEVEPAPRKDSKLPRISRAAVLSRTSHWRPGRVRPFAPTSGGSSEGATDEDEK